MAVNNHDIFELFLSKLMLKKPNLTSFYLLDKLFLHWGGVIDTIAVMQDMEKAGFVKKEREGHFIVTDYAEKCVSSFSMEELLETFLHKYDFFNKEKITRFMSKYDIINKQKSGTDPQD